MGRSGGPESLACAPEGGKTVLAEALHVEFRGILQCPKEACITSRHEKPASVSSTAIRGLFTLNKCGKKTRGRYHRQFVCNACGVGLMVTGFLNFARETLPLGAFRQTVESLCAHPIYQGKDYQLLHAFNQPFPRGSQRSWSASVMRRFGDDSTNQVGISIPRDLPLSSGGTDYGGEDVVSSVRHPRALD